MVIDAHLGAGAHFHYLFIIAVVLVMQRDASWGDFGPQQRNWPFLLVVHHEGSRPGKEEISAFLAL